MNENATTQMYGNVTGELTKCELQSYNPWCGMFGAQQIFELVYLGCLTIIGTLGNLMVIFSIIFEKRVYRHGNVFIINLAVADLIVSGLFVPTMIANVIETGNALPTLACHVAGFILIMTATCSVANLTFIAINRYWAVVHRGSYTRIFCPTKTSLMVLFIWIWSFLLVSPTLYGWSGLAYDYRMMGCAWDDTASLSYNIVFMACSNFIPVFVISFCYWNLFRDVRNRGRWLRKLASPSAPSAVGNENKQKASKREINLLKTLTTSVVVFVLCWVPYVFCVLINPMVHHQAKKVFGWLGVTNSAVNFIIYGLMNPVYRKGYKNLLIYIFCCKIKTNNAKMKETTNNVNKMSPKVNTEPRISRSRLNTIHEIRLEDKYKTQNTSLTSSEIHQKTNLAATAASEGNADVSFL